MTTPDWARAKARDIASKRSNLGIFEYEELIAQALTDAVEEEREACAKVAETFYQWSLYPEPGNPMTTFDEIAQAIRQRKESK